MKTCKWCGKRYDDTQTRGVQQSGNYCSVRCEAAANRERRREYEEHKRRLQEIKNRGGFGAKLLKIIKIVQLLIVVSVLICIYLSLFVFK